MALYAGTDLHSSNTYLGVMDDKFKRVFKKRLKNDLSLILASLEPFREELDGIVVESTYNWYSLVDGLMDGGYKMIDKEHYDLLQKVIRQDIRDSFKDKLSPVQYDDIKGRHLNRDSDSLKKFQK